ncbi:MAG: O-antigen ligase family protein [Flavobacteriales bacterium]|nr:O-antigen ligase family protein [Flavobacteriales bacterium]
MRPIIDVFWYVKENALFSPLQLAGMLTFFFSLVYSLRLPGQGKGQFPLSFNLFAGLLVMNLLLISVELGSASGLIRFVRFITPVILFAYLVKVMKSEERFHGFLFTFLISSIFPLAMLYYETVFDPISYVELSESRGGGYRLTGLYADLFNYMSYLIGDLLIFGYIFVRSLRPGSTQIGVLKIAAVVALAVVGIAGLKHQASWIVTLFIIVSVVLTGFNHQRVKSYMVFIGFPLLLLAPVLILPKVETLFAKEIKAYTGEADSDRILNGRLIRWERHFSVWEDASTISKFFGVSLDGMPAQQKNAMTGGGMHSDYVRFLFAAGIVGLIAFLLFYLRVYVGGRKYRKPEKFFIVTSVGIMCLYSVTSNPFGSSGSLMFLLFSGMALSLNNSKLFYLGTNNVTKGKVEQA